MISRTQCLLHYVIQVCIPGQLISETDSLGQLNIGRMRCMDDTVGSSNIDGKVEFLFLIALPNCYTKTIIAVVDERLRFLLATINQIRIFVV